MAILQRCGMAALVACLLLGAGARAETPITLFKSFAGNVNFTGTQKTMRTKSNSNGSTGACSVVAATTTVKATLSGIPVGAKVLNAQLYWAASGSATDYSITFEGALLAAPPNRQYALNVDTYSYFGGAADVTAQVAARGNGDYSMSGLNVDNGSLYCGNQTVLGGFQLLVVYSLASETFRVLNVYEGFQVIQNSSLQLNLSNFKMPNPLGTATGRMGAITWEGDDTLSGNAEHLQFNGIEMSDGAMNVAGNQFNSASNINNDYASYGIDFDAYTVKSPTIQNGQTSASTYYSSGQDRVLLNAEIIAAPNVPATDRAITMKLDSTLAPSKTSTYTLTVSNNGPMAETALTVTDILPPALIYVSAAGTGWNCSINTQTVTCAYAGPAAVGALLAPITITVTVGASASGSVTNSATVGGALFDHYDSNNTASVSATIGAAEFSPTYVFTSGVCVHNKAFTDPGQTCKLVSLKGMANVGIAGLFITYVSNEIPTSLGSSDIKVPMKFALTCHDPTTTAGARATFTSASGALPTCTPKGQNPPNTSAAWTAPADVVFPGNKPTAMVNNTSGNTFLYPDVGQIELFMSDSSYRLGKTEAFVSQPGGFTLVASAPGTSNQAGRPAAANTPKFVAAGAPFSLSVTALTGGITPRIALNFGREKSPASVEIEVSNAGFTNMVNVPALGGSFEAAVGGVVKGSAFTFAEVGIVKLVPSVNYLGEGKISGNEVNVGRFVPDHFDTAVTAPLVCAAAMACPSTNSKMAYSRQPFQVQVTAVSAPTPAIPATPTTPAIGPTSGTIVKNYQGVFARAVALSAWNGAGTAALVQNPPLSPAGSALAPAILEASAFGDTEKGSVGVNLTYTFPVAYSSAAPRATNLAPPTPVYVRAVEAAGGDGVTSAAGTEDYLVIASGRLQLTHGHGSELLRMPVPVQAQYFLGKDAGWRLNEKDSASAVTAANFTFSGCTKKLGSGAACNTALLGWSGSAVLTLVNGAGTLYLRAPGAGNNGSVDVRGGDPVWLPSTVARLVFGLYKSPLIYLRELY